MRGTRARTPTGPRRSSCDVLCQSGAGVPRGQHNRAAPRGDRLSRRKSAITAADLVRMIEVTRGVGSKAVRDRALLALGLDSALRRSELVEPQLADIVLGDKGARVTIRSSKTDQEREGQVMAIPNGRTILPIARLKAWLQPLLG